MVSMSGLSAGGIVLVTPLMSMVAERSGLRVRRNGRSDRPVRFCRVRDTASAVNTMVRWAWIAYGSGRTRAGRPGRHLASAEGMAEAAARVGTPQRPLPARFG